MNDEIVVTVSTNIEKIEEKVVKDNGEINLSEKNIEMKQNTTEINLLPNDPGLWPEIITSNVAQILIEKGSHQVTEFDFPVSILERKFSKSYYERILPNGEKVHRDWLIYSKCNDSVYCFPCKIFDVNKSSLTEKLGYAGNIYHLF